MITVTTTIKYDEASGDVKVDINGTSNGESVPGVERMTADMLIESQNAIITAIKAHSQECDKAMADQAATVPSC